MYNAAVRLDTFLGSAHPSAYLRSGGSLNAHRRTIPLRSAHGPEHRRTCVAIGRSMSLCAAFLKEGHRSSWFAAVCLKEG